MNRREMLAGMAGLVGLGCVYGVANGANPDAVEVNSWRVETTSRQRFRLRFMRHGVPNSMLHFTGRWSSVPLYALVDSKLISFPEETLYCESWHSVADSKGRWSVDMVFEIRNLSDAPQWMREAGVYQTADFTGLPMEIWERLPDRTYMDGLTRPDGSRVTI